MLGLKLIHVSKGAPGKFLVSAKTKPKLCLIFHDTVKCRYNAVFGVQEIDRFIAVNAL